MLAFVAVEAIIVLLALNGCNNECGGKAMPLLDQYPYRYYPK